MLVTIQCVNVPFGASGSSTRIAMLFALAGTFDHASGGDFSAPSQVYSLGIASFALNALEVTVSLAGFGVSAIARVVGRRQPRISMKPTEIRMMDRGATRMDG